MKINQLIVPLLALLIISIPVAHAKTPPGTYTQQDATGEADLTSHGHYVNKEGRTIHSPSRSKSGKAPAGATAQCRDGSYSFSTHHRGTCSRHGGVASWR